MVFCGICFYDDLSQKVGETRRRELVFVYDFIRFGKNVCGRIENGQLVSSVSDFFNGYQDISGGIVCDIYNRNRVIIPEQKKGGQILCKL